MSWSKCLNGEQSGRGTDEAPGGQRWHSTIAIIRESSVRRSFGLLVSQPDPDFDGVDFSFKYPGARKTAYLPQIDVQVKSWCVPTGAGDTWNYTMKSRHLACSRTPYP